jgi:hypothetical protein
MNTLTCYTLVGQTPVPEPDFVKWAEWFANADRVVFRTELGATLISTVFLGINHQFHNGPPILFETMIFTDGEPEDFQTRCSTWNEAETQHKEALEFWTTRQMKAGRK